MEKKGERSMRKFHLIVWIVACVLAVTGVVLFLVGGIHPLHPSFPQPALSDFRILYYVLLLGGVALMLGNAPYVIFGRRTLRECTMATSLSAVSMGGCVGLGLYCVYTFVTCSLFSSSTSRHPIAIPASFCMGVCALAAFVVLICFYFKRRWKRGFVGFVMDVWSGLVVIAPCFLACCWLHNMVSQLLRA